MPKLLQPIENKRVQLHPATDYWMQGDRYGTIHAIHENGNMLVKLDKSMRLVWFAPKDISERF